MVYMLKFRDTMNFATWIILFTLLSACSLSLSKNAKHSFPRVVTTLGTIEGYYKVANSSRRYEAYEGIPYAEPPIGESRFEVAKEVSPWDGVLMAKRLGSVCLQHTYSSLIPGQNVRGSEDCLYINVYTPRSRGVKGSSKNLLPVIFNIHGGGFQLGGAQNYDPKYIVDNDVILVTFHYRLGPMGFLSTEDDVVPGNMGLKDQVIALRWVKDNIEYFGGDPSRITIFGQSAGAGCVHHLYLTNLTAGLFHGGMSLSGTALNSWAIIENGLENAKKMARIVGCPTSNVQRMVNCLKSRPGNQIVQAMEDFGYWFTGPVVTFGPVIEKGGGNFTFIDRPPIDIITSGQAHDVPWITGVVSGEGLVIMASLITHDALVKDMNENWDTIGPELLELKHILSKVDQPKVARLMKQHYLGTSPIGRSTINQTVNMFGDRIIKYHADEAARIQAQANKSPVRFYHFSYRGAHSVTEALSGTTEDFGACHADDEPYLLASSFDPTTTAQDRAMQKAFINLCVSFARDGVPNVGVDWPAVSRSATEELNYLHIAGPDDMAMKTSLNFGQKKFWHSIGLPENHDGPLKISP